MALRGFDELKLLFFLKNQKKMALGSFNELKNCVKEELKTMCIFNELKRTFF
jgi:hypothetical protein